MTQVNLMKELDVDVTVQVQRVGDQLYLVIMKASGQERITLDPDRDLPAGYCQLDDGRFFITGTT